MFNSCTQRKQFISTDTEQTVLSKCFFQAVAGTKNQLIPSLMPHWIVHTFQSCDITINNAYALFCVNLIDIFFHCETVSEFCKLIFIAHILQQAHQISSFDTWHQKMSHNLKHIRCILQWWRRRIIHTVKSNYFSIIIQRNHHKWMNVLTLQILIL